MKRTIIISTVALVVLFLGAMLVSPSFRSYILGKAETVGTWTPEAIEKDPIGFSNHVERQLNKDLKEYKARRQNTAYVLNRLAKETTEKSKLLAKGNELSEEFAEAIEKGVFPVTVQGREYNEKQIRDQLALILAQTDGLTESLAEFEKKTQAVEQESRKIVIQIEKIESQLTLLAARREIFLNRATTNESLAMIEQVNAVLEENQVMLSDNPVRTIEEFLNNANENAQGCQASSERVDKFLQDYSAQKGGKKNAEVQTENIPEEPAL